ncbi:MAG: DUF3570 domain-containing protein [Pseudomonadota bacterium]|nr:DUF3570 domain-containing protein [Pseudomonadota bacterium]
MAVTKPGKLTQLPAPSPLMKRLSGPLLALPAYQTGTALADAPPAFTEVGLRYTHYSEDSIDQDAVIFGATDRYDIDVTQLWIEAPLGASWSVALDVQNDYQTGASPWFVGAQQNGEPGVIMSGASIQDNRVEVGVTTRYFWADGNAGFAVSHSDEDDYEATALAFDASWNTAEDARTWSTSFSSSRDKLNPTQGVIPVFITEEDLDTQSGYFGVSQILSRTAIARIGLSYTLSEGYLSDPYKYRDQRPDTHERLSLSAGYRRFLIDADASLQIDYRYYADSWGTDSHTVELAWAQNLRGSLLTPYVRYYTQREADFFSVIADTETPHYADDYRLSSYGAVTLGARWAVALGESWTLELEAERYMTDADWGVFDGDAAPALVDFWRGTVGVMWRFD